MLQEGEFRRGADSLATVLRELRGRGSRLLMSSLLCTPWSGGGRPRREQSQERYLSPQPRRDPARGTALLEKKPSRGLEWSKVKTEGRQRRLTQRTEGKRSLLRESADGARHPLPTQSGNNAAHESSILIPEAPVLSLSPAPAGRDRCFLTTPERHALWEERRVSPRVPAPLLHQIHAVQRSFQLLFPLPRRQFP